MDKKYFIAENIIRVTGPEEPEDNMTLVEHGLAWTEIDDLQLAELLSTTTLSLENTICSKLPDEDVYSFEQSFMIDDSTALYGLGQFDDGVVNWRGHECLIAQCYIGSPCPLLVSTGGWGIFWPFLCESHFEEKDNKMTFMADAAESFDFYIILGDDIDSQIRGYRRLTGDAPLMPRYFYGFWQFYNRYKNFDEIHDVVHEYRERGLPLDAIVQDWKYWEDESNENWNSLELEECRYPNPSENITKIHDNNVKFMMTLWPAMGKATDNWRRFSEAGYLLDKISLCEGAAEIYDAFSFNARELYWQIVKEKMLDIGVDALWMDGTEPDCATGAGGQLPYNESFAACGETAVGPVKKVLNGFALASTEGIYSNWRKERKDRCCILTRASYAGIQRTGSAVWSGDTHCRWEDFKRQIPMGINLSMAGIPYWSHDIGGWLWESDLYPEGSADNGFRELHTRWFQLGVFTPMFRTHGSWTPREVYRFGKPGEIFYDSHVKFLKLRSRLLPYIYSLAWKITSQGYTMMRGLSMDFPNDSNVYGIDNQYMFGTAFLVCPVMKPQLYPAPEYGEDAENVVNISGMVDVYLPEGSQWYDFWTNELFEGGQTVSVESPLDHMPLFVKAGSIVPLGPVKNYADEPSEEPLEIRVYPGKDASFTLYDDDGSTYAYEHGDFVEHKLFWDDSTSQLTCDDEKIDGFEQSGIYQFKI